MSNQQTKMEYVNLGKSGLKVSLLLALTADQELMHRSPSSFLGVCNMVQDRIG
jgi:hypothetical protein